MMIKKLLVRSKTVRLIIAYVRHIEAYAYDMRRYIKHGKFGFNNTSASKVLFNLYEKTHSIEKSLIARPAKKGKGLKASEKLAEICRIYHEKVGYDDHLLYSLSVLKSYFDFNVEHKQILDQLLANIEVEGAISNHGRKTINKDEVLQAGSSSFDVLIKNRFSVRAFENSDVDWDKIEAAVQMANHSPSSCNRQTSRVRIFKDKTIIQQLLTAQGGAETFKSEVRGLILVTNETSGWDGVGERNQGLIDSGMFSMTLIHSLLFQGLATCPLNLATDLGKDKKIRKLASILPSERLIMFIAVGNFKETFEVAESKRRKVET